MSYLGGQKMVIIHFSYIKKNADHTLSYSFIEKNVYESSKISVFPINEIV